jgi:hypothetical protein
MQKLIGSLYLTNSVNSCMFLVLMRMNLNIYTFSKIMIFMKGETGKIIPNAKSRYTLLCNINLANFLSSENNS